MDEITISDLEVFFRVGITDEERSKPQRLLLTVVMQLDFSGAARADDLAKTINYDSVCRRLLRLGEQSQWKLIETLAENISTIVLQEFKPDSVQVEVKKFIIPHTRYISVRVRRQQTR